MNCYILHILLLVIILLFICFVICYRYTKHRLKQKNIGALTNNIKMENNIKFKKICIKNC